MNETTIKAALGQALGPSELVSHLDPRLYLAGDWKSGRWPAGLSAGVIESREGYRFRPENVTLAAVIRDLSANTVVDLGSGSGSLALIAGYLLNPTQLIAVERDPGQSDRIRRTLAAHRRPCASVVTGDLREPSVLEAVRTRCGPVDLVVTNPPFYPPGWGRPSSTRSVAEATHALHGGVVDFLRAAKSLLANSGTVVVLFDAAQLQHALAAAASLGFRLVCLVLLPRKPGGPPFRAWLTLRLRGGAQLEWPGLAEGAESD